MNFNDVDPKEYTDSTFGKCIRRRREELKISVRSLAKAIEMSPVYLSDIERGNRNAPTGMNAKKDFMASLVRELKIGDDEIDAFYKMAEVKNDRYPELKSYLDKNPMARLAFQMAKEGKVPDKEWEKFVQRLTELNKENS